MSMRSMCTIVVLRRPGHRWPLLIAANRDEINTRPWLTPARHWGDRPEVRAGLDTLAGGTWLGLNDWGVAAAVLNRINTLGPAPGLRCRGELPLEALDHAEAAVAAAALGHLDADAYRPFNMVIGDASAAFWLRAAAAGDGAVPRIEVLPLPPGLAMITAFDRNDEASPRIRRFQPQFRAAAVPDPDRGDWQAWIELLAARSGETDAGPGGAMTVVTAGGFGTVSSSLIALPAPGDPHRRPIWLFAAGRPGEAPYRPVAR